MDSHKHTFGLGSLMSILIVCLLLAITMDFALHQAPDHYQEKNLETLRAAEHNDLVICVDAKSETKFAFVVDENNETNITGDNVSKRSFSRGDWDISTISAWECTMKIYRPSKTRVAADLLTSILLGLNP